MKAKIIAVKLLELVKRLTLFNEKLGVYYNGFDNAYPERVERIVNNSATAKPCAALYRKYIVGKGFSELNDFIVNKAKSKTLRQFLYDIALCSSYQKGVFVHVNYDGNYDISSVDVLPYNDCRVGKKDDKEYNGKILIYDNWTGEQGRVDKDKIKVFDVFNPSKNIVEEQIKKAGSIQKYKGQILFFNPETTVYPLAHVDNVMNDADSEHQTSVYKNNSLRKGFFGKKIIVTPPLLDYELNRDISELSENQRAEKIKAETERKQFQDNMKSFVGAENIDGMLHLEMEFEGDDIDKIIKVIDIDTNIDDKLFEHTEKSVANNIRKAYSNVPSILIENSESSVFGQSGEMIKQAKLFYQEQTEEDRTNIEQAILKPILKNFAKFTYAEDVVKIIPLINTDNVN